MSIHLGETHTVVGPLVVQHRGEKIISFQYRKKELVTRVSLPDEEFFEKLKRVLLRAVMFEALDGPLPTIGGKRCPTD